MTVKFKSVKFKSVKFKCDLRNIRIILRVRVRAYYMYGTTAKFKSANIFISAARDQTAKFKDRQYFRLYGILGPAFTTVATPCVKVFFIFTSKLFLKLRKCILVLYGRVEGEGGRGNLDFVPQSRYVDHFATSHLPRTSLSHKLKLKTEFES